jgi:galactitol-specific phosphotransferase system IIB component
MNRTIAVEHNLTPIKEYLMEKGYQVETIDFSSEYSKNIDKYDALVVTGMNSDFLGVQDTVSKIPVINAKGLTEEEVFNQISSKVKQ